MIQAAFPAQFNSGVIQPPPADGYNHGDSWGVSATADVDLGFATLTVILAYRKSMPDFVGGRPGFYGSQSERNSQFSLETRLSSPDDQTGRYLSVDFLTRQYQKAVTTTDAALTLEGPDQQWSLTGWVNNIENSIIMNQAFNRPIANVVYAGLRPPRTYGMRASFKF